MVSRGSRVPLPPPGAPGPSREHGGEQPGVLLVDDTGANLVALSAVLSPLGVRLVEATSGPEALKLVQEQTFAVALLDVQMPGMDGFDLARRIRALDHGREMPLIFITAIHREAAFVRRGYALGAADYVTKPFDVEVLRARVRAFVELFQQREAVRRAQVAANESERDEALRRVTTFERIASATLESNDLRALLDELLQIFLDGADAANFATVVLYKGDHVQVMGNAVRGLAMGAIPQEQALSRELCAKVARASRSVDRDQKIRPEPLALPTNDSHALYGVPLWRGDELLGVAYAGSSEQQELTPREQSLFVTIAERAAWAIAKHSERTRMQAERSELLRREQLARREAELASRAKDEFLATLSHELRTPLNAVLGWTARARTKAPPDLQRALEIVARNAEAQARMVDDMLDLSRITNGKLRLELRPLRLVGPILGALEAVRPAAEAKGVELSSEIDESLEVNGDVDRLQQVIWNLLTNAIKFTPTGGRVSLSARAAGDRALVQVSDTGQGISEEFLPNVFTPFRQQDGSSTRKHGGLGLGLAIAKQLTESHAGRLYASSAGLGQGSVFSLELPRQLTAPRRTSAWEGAAGGEEQRLDQIRVLVVDDEPDARNLLSELLTDAGAEVRAVDSASAALSEVRAFRPAVLISDIAMPDADGYQLIEAVRALPADQGGTTKAIALTAYAREEDAARALNAGFQRHLSKPVNLDRLRSMVETLGQTRS